MVKTLYKVLLLDGAVILALYYVLQDLAWRVNCALGQEADCMARSGPSFSSSLLTRSFTMTRGGVSLTSPPILDWVQVLALVLVAVNGWYAYSLLRKRGVHDPVAVQAQGPN